MKTGLSRLLATTALGAPLALVAFAAEATSDIGKVAAVNPSMDGTPPDAGSRTLAIGAGVLQNERIETSEDGSGQLLFLDQTSLSIAPRSDIVLDKYIYDAEQQTGEVAVTLTKGVLRMIGGRITKRRDGIVRTPTATIGVRGGLALVIVDSSGQTRVCHVAGEYTKVDSTQGGQVVLSRPNACAVVAGGAQPVFEGLIEAEELAEIYRQIEGKGNGGKVISADAIDTADISGVNSSEKRGPHDTPVSTSGHSFVPDEVSRDEDEARQDEGVRVFVVEVPVNEIEPPVVEPPEGEPPEEEPLELFVTGLEGGAVTNVGDGATGTVFLQVLQGSLIGEGADGSELRVPVPGTDGVNDAVFDTDNIIANFIPQDSEFSATSLASGSGLFEFVLGDEEFNDFGDFIGGSFSSELGDIVGVGFTDQSEEFTYVEFSDTEPFSGGLGNSTGFAVFGNPTFGQSQFADGDATLSLLPPSGASGVQFIAEINPALLTDDLVNGIPNTVEAFRVQPNQFLHSVRFDAPRRGQTPFFMVGNQGFARYARSDTTIDAGSDIRGSDLVGGGKWLNGALYIGDESAGGTQVSSFMVFADDIKTFDGAGPIVSGTAFTTDFAERFDAESGLVEQVFAAGTLNIGSLEDQRGNTVFGETNRYLVLSNLHRDGLDDESVVPPDFSNDAGSSVGLVQIDGDTSFDGTTSVYNEITEDAGDFNALLARDESLNEVIANPLPLAGARVETFYDAPAARQIDVLDRGFAAGMAVCEGGLCGDVDSFRSDNTGFSDEITDFSGTYAVRSRDFDDFSLTFGGHELRPSNTPGLPDEAVNFDVSNQVQAVFSVASTGVGDLDGANVEGNFASFRYQGGGTRSAHIDDNRFAALALDSTTAIVTEGADRANAQSSFAIASSGLVGSGDLEFPTETELEPQFARWGWWSSTLEAPIEGSTETRTDIVHLGNWVAGVGVDFRTDHIPSSGVASFDGLAVGTMTNLISFDRRIVGGDFNMTYNFASQSGNFNLNIPDASLNENVAITGFNDVFNGRNTNAVTNTVTDVSGAFFANPTVTDFRETGLVDGIAGVGGTFESVNVNNATHTTGVFAGDRTTFTPRLTLDITSADVVPGTDPIRGGVVNTPGGVPITGGTGVTGGAIDGSS